VKRDVFIVHASDIALGAVLQQEQNGKHYDTVVILLTLNVVN